MARNRPPANSAARFRERIQVGGAGRARLRAARSRSCLRLGGLLAPGWPARSPREPAPALRPLLVLASLLLLVAMVREV